MISCTEGGGLFFLQRFFNYLCGLLCCETDFVTFWVNFDENNAKEEWLKFDTLKVRGLMLMV